MVNLKLQAFKAGFFDRKAVVSKVDQATRRVLSKFGAFVRRRAQTSIRYRKDVSAPMGPPHAHKSGTVVRKSKRTGETKVRTVSFLRKFLFFAWDDTHRSVVIGPAKLNNTVSSLSLPALEYGGRSVALEDGLRKSIRVKPRPFMRPALEAEKPQLPALWRDSVR